jgi:hypothetical protein
MDLGTLLNIYNFLKELTDHKVSMKEEHSSEGEYLIIKFTAIDTRSLHVRLFSSYILWSSIKPWTVKTRSSHSIGGRTYLDLDLTSAREIEKFEQIHVKFPKTSSGKEAYNTMVNAYHNLDLVDQFKVLTYLKHLCDPNVSSFRNADLCMSKLSSFETFTCSSDDRPADRDSVRDYYSNFKMEITIS